jgi:hypothetical protein
MQSRSDAAIARRESSYLATARSISQRQQGQKGDQTQTPERETEERREDQHVSFPLVAATFSGLSGDDAEQAANSFVSAVATRRLFPAVQRRELLSQFALQLRAGPIASGILSQDLLDLFDAL